VTPVTATLDVESLESITQKIDANAFQCTDSPLWVLLLLAMVQLAKEVFDELWIPVFQDGFSC